MASIFVNRFFHPDHSATSQMLSDLAFALAARGEDVKVVTSRLRYDDPDARLAPAETIAGVGVVRVWTSRFGRANLKLRAIDYATFYVSCAWTLLRHARRGDVVVAKTDPPMLSVVVGPVVRLRGARLVNWHQDLFPEVAEALGLGGRALAAGFALLRRLRDRSVCRAAMNVAIGHRMADRLAGLGVARSATTVIPNWADCSAIRPVPRDNNELRQTWGLAGSFVVGYSGNLGRAHETETMLTAIEHVERLRHEGASVPAVKWLFIGGGAQLKSLQEEVRRRSLDSVQFRPYQPREKLSESLSAADVHLVSLRPELEGLIVPSKIYGIAAAGRPAVFIGEAKGEVARMLAEETCGMTVAMNDAAALVAAVMDLARDPLRAEAMGRRARKTCERRFDKAVAVASWERLLDRAVRDERPAAREAVVDGSQGL